MRTIFVLWRSALSLHGCGRFLAESTSKSYSTLAATRGYALFSVNDQGVAPTNVPYPNDVTDSRGTGQGGF